MSIAITYDKLRREIGRFRGFGRDPIDPTHPWDATQVQDVADILENGLRRFYWPLPTAPDQDRHVWSFLCPTVNLAISSNAWVYDLPEDFTELIAEFSFPVGSNINGMAKVSPQAILSMQSQAQRTGAPQYFAVRTKTPLDGFGTRYEVLFYPTPDTNYTLTYQYSVTPKELDSTNQYPLGSAQHSETILEACLAETEKMLGDAEGLHEKRFRELLAASIQYDKALMAKATQAWPFELSATDLQVNKAYLKRLIGMQFGYGPHPALWDHPKTQNVKLALETGMRKFYAPNILPGEKYSHTWSFLNPKYDLLLVPGQYAYDLPEDFAMFSGLITYEPGAAVLYAPLKIIDERQLALRLQRNEQSARPVMAAYRPKPLDQAFGTRYELLFWPVPDQAYGMNFRYTINPNALSDDASLPFGGQPNMQTIIEACLCAVEELQGKPGVHSAAFVEALRASVSHDRKVNAPDSLGTNIDRGNHARGHFGSCHDLNENIVSYNGIEY